MAKGKKAAKSGAAKIVAEIALYGTHAAGAGFIVSTPGGEMSGNGELVPHRGLTEAVWMAVFELKLMGVAAGVVRIFAPGGKWMSEVDIGEVGYYGNLQWKPAIQYEVSVEKLIAAAEVPA